MIEHFHIVEPEAFFLLKHVCLDRSKVCRRDPDLFCNDEEVDETALNVADEDEDKDDE